jgi:hypothetical protein
MGLLDWFDPWLLELKSCLKFFRHHMTDFKEYLEWCGLDGAATLLGAISFTTFAAWRWKKLAAVTRSLGKAFEVLELPSVVEAIRGFKKKLKDSNTVDVLLKAFADFIFMARFKFVDWYAQAFTYLESWGSSCMCHQQEWMDGVSVDCKFRGRLLPIAYQFAFERLNELIQEALTWTVDTWGLDVYFLTASVGVVRATADRSFLKIGYLDRLPYLFARLGFESGVRARILSLYNGSKRHDRVTESVTTPDTELRMAFDSMRSDFDLSNDLLRYKVQSIRDAPNNDEVNEMPHATFSRIHFTAPISSFPWKASTCRTDLNLKDCYQLSTAADEDLQRHYNGYRNILQVNGRKRDRKMRRDRFEEMVYRCSHIIPLWLRRVANPGDGDVA